MFDQWQVGRNAEGANDDAKDVGVARLLDRRISAHEHFVCLGGLKQGGLVYRVVHIDGAGGVRYQKVAQPEGFVADVDDSGWYNIARG